MGLKAEGPIDKNVTIPLSEYEALMRKRTPNGTGASRKSGNGGSRTKNNNKSFTRPSKSRSRGGSVLASRQSYNQGANADIVTYDATNKNKFASSGKSFVSKYSHVNGAFNNISREILDEEYLCPANTINRRIAMARIPSQVLTTNNGKNSTGMYGVTFFTKIFVLGSDLSCPVWQTDFTADGQLLIQAGSIENQDLFDPEYTMCLTIGPQTTRYYGVFGRIDRAFGILGGYHLGFNRHAFSVQVASSDTSAPSPPTGFAAPEHNAWMKLKRLRTGLRELKNNKHRRAANIVESFKEINNNNNNSNNNNNEGISGLTDCEKLYSEKGKKKKKKEALLTDYYYTFMIVGDPTVQVEMTLYASNGSQINTWIMSNQQPVSIAISATPSLTGFVTFDVINNGSSTSDIYLTTVGTTTMSSNTSSFADYNNQNYISYNMVGMNAPTLDTTVLSNECRIIRTLAVCTDVEALNTLNGTVTQAFVYGTEMFTMDWQSYLSQSPTVRTSALAKGFDMFWVAQEGEYSWSDKWLCNPFTNPGSTPSVVMLTANYNANTMQLQQKYYLWTEYTTTNPAIPAVFVLDCSQEWFTLISAYMNAFRFCENFDHKKVLKAISEMAKWVAGGSPEAVALRNTLKSFGKLAIKAAPAAMAFL